MSKHTVILATLASFIATRTVQAKPMNRQEYNDLRGWEVEQDFDDGDDGYLVVNSGVSERNVDGFDGYVSWLPKLAFEEQYKPNKDGLFYFAINDDNGVYIGEADTVEQAKANALKIKETHELADEFDFGMALHLLKAGQKVARKGWNGAGQFVYYVPANKYPADQNPNSPIKGHFDNDQVPYRAYLALKTAQNDVATWQPSISDVLADDWVIVE